jgi:hypothetical protein
MHPPGSMFDEYHHVEAFQQHGVHVEKVDSEDSGGLGAQELLPGRARSAGSRIDTRSAQDLPDGGWRDGHTKFRRFAMDPAVSPQRILLRRPNDKAGDAGTVGGRPGLRQLLVSYLLAASLWCQASSVAGVTAKTLVQRLRGMSRASAASHTRLAGS